MSKQIQNTPPTEPSSSCHYERHLDGVALKVYGLFLRLGRRSRDGSVLLPNARIGEMIGRPLAGDKRAGGYLTRVKAQLVNDGWLERLGAARGRFQTWAGVGYRAVEHDEWRQRKIDEEGFDPCDLSQQEATDPEVEYIALLRSSERLSKNPLPDEYLVAIASDRGWFQSSAFGEAHTVARALRFLEIKPGDERLADETSEFRWALVHAFDDWSDDTISPGELALVAIGVAFAHPCRWSVPRWFVELTVGHLTGKGVAGWAARRAADVNEPLGPNERLLALGFYRACEAVGLSESQIPVFSEATWAFRTVAGGCKDTDWSAEKIRRLAERAGAAVPNWWPSQAGIMVEPVFRDHEACLPRPSGQEYIVRKEDKA